MSFRSGFFNSKNHDKQYYASDISKLFDSLINPGVFGNVGNKFIARPGEGMQVIIPSGMAWFNSTWTLNDSDVVINIDEAPYIAQYSRIDAIFLRIYPVDDTGARDNGAYYVKGTETSATPSKPVPTATDGELYIPICYITVANGTTSITAAMIENCVGTVNCPFITGILETVDITQLLTQWEAQWNDWLNAEKTDFEAWAEDRQTAFTEWFENLQYVLDGDVAGHLQNEIDELLPVRKRTITNLLNPTLENTTSGGVTCTNNGDDTYTLNGTPSTIKNFFLLTIGNGYEMEANKTYRLCGCPSGGSSTTYELIAEAELGTAFKKQYAHDFGDGATFTVPQADIDAGYKLRITMTIRADVDNVVFKPMLTTDLYATYDDFVQYSGDGELNENVAGLRKWIQSLQNSFSQALTDLKATAIAQAVGATGSTFTSVIAKLAEIVNRGAWSANMANTGSVTIPKGYHDGTGTVKTSGTASITYNANGINIAQYSNVNVKVAPIFQDSFCFMENAGNRSIDRALPAGNYYIYAAVVSGEFSYNSRYISAVQIVAGSGTITQNTLLTQAEHHQSRFIALTANSAITLRFSYVNESNLQKRTIYLMSAFRY